MTRNIYMSVVVAFKKGHPARSPVLFND